MTDENEHWISQLERKSPALSELLRDFGYTKADWDALDPAEKEHLAETAISCYCINHGIVPLEKGTERNVLVPIVAKPQVSACKLW